jgi:hypothetical protein
MKCLLLSFLLVLATALIAQVSSAQQPAPASAVFPDITTSTTPLTVNGKFKLFAGTSVSPARFAGANLTAGFGQAIDTPAGYGQGTQGYAKRFGASMATGASNNFFGKFLIPSVLHHDPRFVSLENRSLRNSIGLALRRVVIARTDDGNDTFNWSGILGPLAAQSIANSYLPDEERTVGKTPQLSRAMC